MVAYFCFLVVCVVVWAVWTWAMLFPAPPQDDDPEEEPCPGCTLAAEAAAASARQLQELTRRAERAEALLQAECEQRRAERAFAVNHLRRLAERLEAKGPEDAPCTDSFTSP